MPYTQQSYFVALRLCPTFCFADTIGDKSIFEIPRAMCIRICAYALDLLGCQVCPYSLFKTRKPHKFIYFFFFFLLYISLFCYHTLLKIRKPFLSFSLFCLILFFSFYAIYRGKQDCSFKLPLSFSLLGGEQMLGGTFYNWEKLRWSSVYEEFSCKRPFKKIKNNNLTA